VLGVLPGVVGLLQANQVLAIVAGYGEPLVGRLLAFDALSSTFRTMRVRRDPACRDPACPVCRDGAQIELSDLATACVPAQR
jgi:molybdopterin/thiamine biosynthesis adenylyltransferase